MAAAAVILAAGSATDRTAWLNAVLDSGDRIARDGVGSKA